MDPNVKLCVDQRDLLSNPKRYFHLVGKLTYLTTAHPNISFAISIVSQNMATSSLGLSFELRDILKHIQAVVFCIKFMITYW